MTREERIKQLENSSIKRFEEAAEKYPDIRILWDDYNKLLKEPRWTKEFLDGYSACISDLIIVKQML